MFYGEGKGGAGCAGGRGAGARAGGGWQNRADAEQGGAGRAHSCSKTATAGTSSAEVSGELAGAVAPGGAEVRDVGRAVTTVAAWCRARAGAASGVGTRLREDRDHVGQVRISLVSRG